MSTSPFSLTCYAQPNISSNSSGRRLTTAKNDLLIIAEEKNLKFERKQVLFKRREAIGLGFSLPIADFLFRQQSEEAVAADSKLQCELTGSPSGLAYCDIVVGFGPEALKGQLIKAHYVGKLDNGTVFDSSYNRGKPLTFRLGAGEVIKGWDEGILGGNGIPPMLTGGKRILRIPADLGYGMRGAGCRGGSCIIPPDSVLIFDVEFIGKA
ncbi:peptidyl-prolyl cis-trans isomerase FKBP13, chloroplastic-like [Impatiens glandulifera]|uniref:peptidyl-prolyl cis-trans isomerase FKBP13, chloroplastic-like n=1 Tax=Impatiens glandulifera TaxID=253017 RepID=UPI001FB0B037|nr:peptidyl-prolyl cis-trans isomerase FKBP13, chloroplastic-like [Impatiens glandulifera]